MKNIKVKSYSENSSLVYSIIFFIIGALLFSNPGGVIKFISYVIGILLILIGIIRLMHYNKLKNKMLVTNHNDFVFSIISIVLGIISIISANAIEIAIRFVVGGWILFSGINRLSIALNNKVNNKLFLSLLIISILMILLGLYIIIKSNIVFSIIGILIMIFSIFEIIGYVTYKKINN